VFLAPKPRQPGTPPVLGQVRDSFPLPGQYHFRFKAPLFPGADREKGAMAVWMDAVNDSTAVPTWKNTIVAKVTRVSAGDDDDDDDDEDFGGVHYAAPAPAPAPAPTPPPQAPPTRAPPSHQTSAASQGSNQSPHLDIFGDSPSAASSAPAPATAPNLFDAVPPPAPASGSSLLDMNDYGSQPSQASGNVHADFFGMTAPVQGAAPTPTQQPRPQQGYPGQNMYNVTPQQQQQQQQQQQHPPQQQHGGFQRGPFGDLGTPWK
jgi:hypothetical protein